MSTQQRSVRLQGIPVGILSQESDGRMQFTYDKQTTTPISLAMPIRERPLS